MNSYKLLTGKKIIAIIYIITILTSTLCGCKKYLDTKPDLSLTTPSNLEDLQAVMDNDATMNTSYPSAAEILSDDYYITNDGFKNITYTLFRDYYLWRKNTDTNVDWITYGKVYYSNVVLDNLPKIKYNSAQQRDWNAIKGSALFFRSFYFYALSQLFAPAYDLKGKNDGPGIPLRLNADFTNPSTRATIQQNYDQMLGDLKASVQLLPNVTPFKNRPTKPAAYGLISRIYLIMQEYKLAKVYADSCLQISHELLDFNTLDSTRISPIPAFNKEVIFNSRTLGAAPLSQSIWNADTLLMDTYAKGDLRKVIYFNQAPAGSFSFKGGYTGTSNGFAFTGIATDEIYLIRAECYARSGDSDAALTDLNALLSKRMKPENFSPLVYANDQLLLKRILDERRKELVFRTLRWSDLRRLNMEGTYKTSLKRVIDGEIYELLPGQARYVLQIPATVINHSGMPQNP